MHNRVSSHISIFFFTYRQMMSLHACRKLLLKNACPCFRYKCKAWLKYQIQFKLINFNKKNIDDMTHHDIMHPPLKGRAQYGTHMQWEQISFSLSIRETGVKGLWWIDIMVSGWTSDSWLLYSGEWAPSLSTVSVSSSHSAHYSVAKHNVQISYNRGRQQRGNLHWTYTEQT